MKKALKSANGQQALAGLEEHVRKAEEFAKHEAWAAKKLTHDRWQARTDYCAWWYGGGRLRWNFDKKMEKGEVWNGPVPPDPGPAPGLARAGIREPWPGARAAWR